MSLTLINNGDSGNSARSNINAAITQVNAMTGVGLWQQVDCGNEYDATVADLGKSMVTDLNNGSTFSLLRLPPIESAFANGGTIRVSAAREYNSNGHCIAVYANAGDGGNLFVIGAAGPLYSLYSTGIGDFLELQAINLGGNLYWRAQPFSGLWQDRD
jgi:hypothetical protein